MPTEIFFILVLHSIAAVITLIIALRDGLGFLQALRWGDSALLRGSSGSSPARGWIAAIWTTCMLCKMPCSISVWKRLPSTAFLTF